LADKPTEGKLTPEEREEYDVLIQVRSLVGILQQKVRQLLAESNGAE